MFDSGLLGLHVKNSPVAQAKRNGGVIQKFLQSGLPFLFLFLALFLRIPVPWLGSLPLLSLRQPLWFPCPSPSPC